MSAGQRLPIATKQSTSEADEDFERSPYLLSLWEWDENIYKTLNDIDKK